VKKIFKDIYNSFKNKADHKLSARKLTSFTFVTMAFYLHYAHVNDSNAVEVLIVDVSVVLILLGIVTVQNIIDFKNGNSEKTEN